MVLTALAPYGPSGASARARVTDWLSRLDVPYRLFDYIGAANASPGTLLHGVVSVTAAELALRDLDVSQDTLLLHREASPLSRGDLEVRLLRSARRSVFDFDDAMQWDFGRGLRSLFPKGPKVEQCVRSADVVVAGSEILADWASRFAGEVRLIPSCVDPDDYPDKTDYALAEAPVIGWVGSPTTERHLQSVQEPLLSLHRATGARLVVVSAGAAPLGPLDAMVDRVAWDAATVGRVMARFDVAIAPLKAELFPRGKCAYKILQYGSAGLPVVGGATGANRQVLSRLGAAAAATVQDWLDALQDLLAASESERAAQGAVAQQRVRQYYSFEVWEPFVRRVLSGEAPVLR